ncbi:MAG: NAD(+) synthase [Clostridiales bacterium]|nr:NAD(+) synthase [Clostridiales bacterium]
MSGELKKINPDKLAKLAEALDVSVEYLNGDTATSKTDTALTRADDGYLGIVKVACISPDVRVADCDYNAREIIKRAKLAYKNGVKIALFPELSITAYTCGDLFFQSALRNSALSALKTIRDELASLDLICIVGLPICSDFGKMYNTAAVLYRGDVLGIVPKINLPNYNEFFEKRLFAAYDRDNTTINLFGKQVPFGNRLIFANTLHNDVRFAIEVCEDVWVADSPSVSHSYSGANAVFNLSASNETVIKSDYRKKMIEIQSGKCGVIYAYCSSGPSESTSQTVFSAHNIICENGECIAESKPFAYGYAEATVDFDFIENERARLDKSQTFDKYTVVNFEQSYGKVTRKYNPTPFVPNDDTCDEVCEKTLTILAYALKKRVEHIKANKLVLGISGGSDSTLALIVCERALKLMGRPTSDILAITMPCFGTSKRTYDNAVALTNAFGATLREVNITAAVTQHLHDINHDLSVTDVTYENAQARERTQVLMDIANQCNGIVIGTGDMSELALGWATYNGDHMSMYGVNASVPKTLVKTLLRYQAKRSNKDAKMALLDVLDTPVSPELLPTDKEGNIAQITENSVGPYELHDYFLFMMIRKGFTPRKVYELAKVSFAGKYDEQTILKWLKFFIRRLFTQQFKRSCSPDSVRLGSVDLSKLGFRMPSDACYDAWLADLDLIR